MNKLLIKRLQELGERAALNVGVVAGRDHGTNILDKALAEQRNIYSTIEAVVIRLEMQDEADATSKDASTEA